MAESQVRRREWQHQEGDRYSPVACHYVGNAAEGFHAEWECGGVWFASLDRAIQIGFQDFGSDDFNVIVYRDGALLALLWMHEDLEESRKTLEEVAEHICLPLHAPTTDPEETSYEDRRGGDLPECGSCSEGIPRDECPESLYECGHHCNCSWVYDECCWCGARFGEAELAGEGGEAP